jgi:pyruvate kinase
MMTEKIYRVLKSKGKCVLIYSNFLESMLKQHKPTMSELSDIKSFVEMGIDGYVLGSETLDRLRSQSIVKCLLNILE